MASASSVRIAKAFAHLKPDRTPLFEIFQPYHPIHWDICGRTIATEEALAWDARADGVAWEELVEAEARAQFSINKFFGLDMVRLHGAPPRDYSRPVKTGKNTWTLNGVPYLVNPRTQLVERANPGLDAADSRKASEESVRRRLEAWDGKVPEAGTDVDPVFRRVRELAEREGIEWLYMGEIGAGTGVAFYPPSCSCGCSRNRTSCGAGWTCRRRSCSRRPAGSSAAAAASSPWAAT